MADNSLPYDDGGWLEPGRTLMVTLAPDECVIRPVDDGWRCVRDHECGPDRWWEASQQVADWDRMTYDEQRAFLGLQDVAGIAAKRMLRAALHQSVSHREAVSRMLEEWGL